MIGIELLEWLGGALIVGAIVFTFFIRDRRHGKN